MIAAAALLIGAFGFFVVKRVLPSSHKMTNGYISYYTSAYLFIHDEMGPQAYDGDWFTGKVESLIGQPIHEGMYFNLPTMCLLMVPIAFFSAETARIIWIWFNFIILMVSVGIIIGVFKPSLTFRQLRSSRFLVILLFCTIIFVSQAVSDNFLLGQAYVFLLFLFSLVLLGLSYKKDWLAGIALGLALILKSSGGPIWLFLLIKGRWRALAWGGATLLFLFLLSLPKLGWEIWQIYPRETWELLHHPNVASSHYQTIYSFFSRLFVYNAEQNPQPLAQLPRLPQILNLLVTILLLAVTFYKGHGAQLSTVFSVVIVLTVITSPVAENHHYAILIISAGLVLNSLLSTSASFLNLDWLLLAIACLLLVAPLPYKNHLSPGWLAFLVYPRLFGGLLLWYLCLRSTTRYVVPQGTAR